MRQQRKYIPLAFLILLLSCSKNDESMINYVEIGEILSEDQYRFFDNYDNLDVEINTAGAIRGVAYRASRPSLIQTNLEFSPVSQVSFPSSIGFGGISYQNEDTVIVSKNDRGELAVYRSVNGKEFTKIISLSTRDVNGNSIYTSNVVMLNGTIGYFYQNRPKWSNDSTKYYKIIGEQLSITAKSKIDAFGRLDIFPSGKLLTTFWDNSNQQAIYAHSLDEGKSWEIDTLSWDNRYFINEIIADDFMLAESNGLYRSSDGKNWEQISPPGIREINDFHFIDRNTGYFIEQISKEIYGDFVRIYKTNDGGNTWNIINQDALYASKIYFKNSSFGIAYTNEAFQISTDGGISWELKALKEIFRGP